MITECMHRQTAGHKKSGTFPTEHLELSHPFNGYDYSFEDVYSKTVEYEYQTHDINDYLIVIEVVFDKGTATKR